MFQSHIQELCCASGQTIKQKKINNHITQGCVVLVVGKVSVTVADSWLGLLALENPRLQVFLFLVGNGRPTPLCRPHLFSSFVSFCGALSNSSPKGVCVGGELQNLHIIQTPRK